VTELRRSARQEKRRAPTKWLVSQQELALPELNPGQRWKEQLSTAI
jgi:hypothetical protein